MDNISSISYQRSYPGELHSPWTATWRLRIPPRRTYWTSLSDVFFLPPTSAAGHGGTADTWYLVQERDRNPRRPKGRSHILNV